MPLSPRNVGISRAARSAVASASSPAVTCVARSTYAVASGPTRSPGSCSASRSAPVSKAAWLRTAGVSSAAIRSIGNWLSSGAKARAVSWSAESISGETPARPRSDSTSDTVARAAASSPTNGTHRTTFHGSAPVPSAAESLASWNRSSAFRARSTSPSARASRRVRPSVSAERRSPYTCWALQLNHAVASSTRNPAAAPEISSRLRRRAPRRRRRRSGTARLRSRFPRGGHGREPDPNRESRSTLLN